MVILKVKITTTKKEHFKIMYLSFYAISPSKAVFVANSRIIRFKIVL